MKKPVFSAVVLALAVGTPAWFLLRHPAQRSFAAALLPIDTLAVVEFPDLEGSRDRWSKTELRALLGEPAVKAFLEKPLAQPGAVQELGRVWAQMAKLEAQTAFLAMTNIEGKSPKLIGGMFYRGRPEDIRAMMRPARERLESTSATGMSDRFDYEGDTIETLIAEEMTLAESYTGRWYLVANDVELLKQTLDRVNNRAAAPSLKESGNFRAVAARMPRRHEIFVFARPGALMDRLAGALISGGPDTGRDPFGGLAEVKAVGMATSFEGARIRERIFQLRPPGKQASMGGGTMALTSVETALYFTTLFHAANMNLPHPSVDPTGMLDIVDAWAAYWAEQGLTLDGFGAAFGPEVSGQIDWGPNSAQPGLLLAVAVRDRAKAEQFTDMFANGKVGDSQWVKSTVEGAAFYTLPLQLNPLVVANPTIGLDDRFLVAGLSYNAVRDALAQADASIPRLDSRADFKTAIRLVSPPGSALAFVDTKVLIERGYAMFRQAAILGASLSVGEEANFDPSKLPPPEALGDHLSPIAMSSKWTEDGVLTESVGPVTFFQATAAVAAGLGSWLAPMVNQQRKRIADAQKGESGGGSSEAPKKGCEPKDDGLLPEDRKMPKSR